MAKKNLLNLRHQRIFSHGKPLEHSVIYNRELNKYKHTLEEARKSYNFFPQILQITQIYKEKICQIS